MEERTKIKLKNVGERTAFLSVAVPFWAVTQALAPLTASVKTGKMLREAEKEMEELGLSKKKKKTARKQGLKKVVEYWLRETFSPTLDTAENVYEIYKQGTERLKEFDKLEVEKVRRAEEEKKTAEARAAEKARRAEINSEKALRESGVAEFLSFIDGFPLTEEVASCKCPINKLKEFFSEISGFRVERAFNDLLKQKDVKTFPEIYDELKKGRFDERRLEEKKKYFFFKYLMERFEINAQKYFYIVKIGNTYVIESDGKHAELRLPNFEAEGKDLVLVFPVEQLDSVYGHINDWAIRRKKERETTIKNNVADALRRGMLTQKDM